MYLFEHFQAQQSVTEIKKLISANHICYYQYDIQKD